MLSVTTMPSPVGELTIGASDKGLRFVLWHNEVRHVAGAKTTDPKESSQGVAGLEASADSGAR